MCPANAGIGPNVNIGSDLWNVGAYETASIASRTAYRLSGHINQHLKIVSISMDVWKLDRQLKNFVEGIYRDIEAVEPPSEPVSEVKVREAISLLKNLHETIERMYEKAKAIGLTNRTLVGAGLNSVRVRADEILDFAESVELSLDPAVDSVFDRAMRDLESGQALDLSALK